MIAKNPVATAKFFHLMVEPFIKNVLQISHNSNGLFGPITAFYITVESQRSQTLQLPSLGWIKNTLSPKEIRE